ncbi:phospholipid carrier-dependent glycosyltransferase, partial [Dactylosporangium sp. NPDC005555]
MTSVLTDASETPQQPAGPSLDGTARPVADAVRRRLARPGPATPAFWLAAVLVTGIALLLRMVNLSHPKETVFDEVYYANEAWDLLQHGVEWNPEDNTPQYV